MLDDSKVGVVFVPYIENDAQREIMDISLDTFRSKVKLKSYAVINKWRAEDIDYFKNTFDYYEYNKENCVAMAWNTGIRRAIDDNCRYIIVSNLDVTLTDFTIDMLVKFAVENPDAIMWSPQCSNSPPHPQSINGMYEVNHATMWDNYALFMVDDRLFKEVGMFDENIKPAYCEDQDMQYRIELKGFKHLCTTRSVFIHQRNVTINFSDNRDWALNNLTESVSGRYLIKKWGGIRGSMSYKTPFNS